MAPHRVKNPADEVSEGQEIMVKCLVVDANGKIKLSRKALMAAEPSATLWDVQVNGPVRALRPSPVFSCRAPTGFNQDLPDLVLGQAMLF